MSFWVNDVSEADQNRMKVSREGLLLIKSFEGFRPRAVARAAGGFTVGYGHVRSARADSAVTEQEAELLLQYDLIPVVTAIREAVTAPLNQHQFDALASFGFSVGPDAFKMSEVVRELNAGHAAQAAEALAAAPEPSAPDTLSRRRAAERALFIAEPARAPALSNLMTAPIQARASIAELRAAVQPAVTAPEVKPAKAPAPTGASSWPYLVIGAVGMVAFGAAVAAFRRAAIQGDAGQIGLIGWGLAVVAAACLGVAALRLFRAAPEGDKTV